MNFSSERWGGNPKIHSQTHVSGNEGRKTNGFLFFAALIFSLPVINHLFNYLRRLRILFFFVLSSLESVFESAGGGVGLLLALLLYSHAVV